MGVFRRPGAALAVLTGINVVNYLDRYMGGALVPLISADLHLSHARAGILQTAFIVIYSVVSPIVGWLGDRHHRLRLAAFGVALWSASTFGAGLAPTFALLLCARAIVGVGEASYSVVTPSLISDLYPPNRRGRALSIFYAALAVGPALGYIIGGWIGKNYGWRPAMFVGGGPGILLALFLLLIEEPKRGRFDPPRKIEGPRTVRAFLAALRSRQSYLFNTAAQALSTFSLGGLAYWMPTYFVTERHLALDKANYMFGLLVLVAGFSGTIIGGQVGDWMARRYPGGHFVFSGWALLASIPFTLLATLSPRPAIFWPAMFCTLLLLFLNTGPLNAAMANVLPADLRARAFALYTVAIHMFGDAPSPYIIGAVSDVIGLRLPVLFAGLLLGMSGLVLLAGRRSLVIDLRKVAS